MNYYQDIKLLPDEEVPVFFIRNKIFSKFHKALFDLQQNNIGVSFPDYKNKLGYVIRIHGEKSDLEDLQKSNWPGGLSGYCEFSDISVIPDKVQGYRTIFRVRQNMTNSKLNRLIRRDSISKDKVKNYKEKMISNGLNNPYLELKSQSSGEQYRIYIAMSDLLEQPVVGKFNFFGLSKVATIPWF